MAGELARPVVRVPTTRGVTRQTRRALQEASQLALIEAGHIKAAAYVADVAMRLVAQNAVTERELTYLVPHAEHRLRVIAETFAGVAVSQVAQMAI